MCYSLLEDVVQLGKQVAKLQYGLETASHATNDNDYCYQYQEGKIFI